MLIARPRRNRQSVGLDDFAGLPVKMEQGSAQVFLSTIWNYTYNISVRQLLGDLNCSIKSGARAHSGKYALLARQQAAVLMTGLVFDGDLFDQAQPGY